MGCQATDDMSRAWPCHDVISRLVCRTSHTLTVRSRLQEASQVPLRFQHTWVCGRGVSCMCTGERMENVSLHSRSQSAMLCAEGGNGKLACQGSVL